MLDLFQCCNMDCITGTCKNCACRFKLVAEEVINSDIVRCPNCNIEFDSTGLAKIQMMAQVLNNRKNGNK